MAVGEVHLDLAGICVDVDTRTRQNFSCVFIWRYE